MRMELTKLCVGVPNLGSIKALTTQCIISSLFRTVIETGCGLHLSFPFGCYIDENRNEIVKDALREKCSHIMFIDSDMVFPDNGILSLLERDKQIIGANYNVRSLPLRCTVKMADIHGNFLPVPGDKLPKTPFPCAAVATGFMLIQVEIFSILDKPWFFYEYDKEKDDTVGEDIYFCKRAKEKDIEVWCDPTIMVRHIGDYVY